MGRGDKSEKGMEGMNKDIGNGVRREEGRGNGRNEQRRDWRYGWERRGKREESRIDLFGMRKEE
jgi:hypothetical protein